MSDFDVQHAGSAHLTILGSRTTDHTNVRFFYDKPRFEDKYNGVWQRVNENVGIFLFSAFYDDRPDIPERPVIRTIAVVRIDSSDDLLCLLWLEGNELTLVVNATKTETGDWRQTRAGMFHSVILSCAVRTEAGRPALIPEHVSIVTATQTAAKTLLRVQFPETPERPMAFGHCMSVAYRHHDPYRVVEWMELHRMWGVEEVTIYKNSLHPETARVYRYYADKGFVNLMQAHSAFPAHPNDEEAILLNMAPVLNDCLYRNMYRYRRLVVTDIDEMIVPRIHHNYTAMLDEIDDEFYNMKSVISYVFNNVYFFSDLNATTPSPYNLVTQQYTRHVAPSPMWDSARAIHNPLACLGLQNNLCLEINEGNVIQYSPRSIGMNHHYKECHFDRGLKKPRFCDELMQNFSVDLTMTLFGNELESRVAVVLKELDLI